MADAEGEAQPPGLVHRVGGRPGDPHRRAALDAGQGTGEGGEPELTYFEWSLDYDDPNDVPEEAYLDEDSYWESNPAYGIQDLQRALRVRSQGARQTDRRSGALRRRRLPRPARDRTSDRSPSSSGSSASRRTPSSSTRSASPSTSVPREGPPSPPPGRTRTGCGTSRCSRSARARNWVAERLEELIFDHAPEMIVCDALGPGKSLVQTAGAGGDRRRDLRLGAARGGLWTIRGRGDRAVAAAPREPRSAERDHEARRRRPLGDRWAWSRKTSSGGHLTSGGGDAGSVRGDGRRLRRRRTGDLLKLTRFLAETFSGPRLERTETSDFNTDLFETQIGDFWANLAD